MTDRIKQQRTCPVCNRRHEWTPFCPGCEYEYQGRVVNDNIGSIPNHAESTPPRMFLIQ